MGCNTSKGTEGADPAKKPADAEATETTDAPDSAAPTALTGSNTNGNKTSDCHEEISILPKVPLKSILIEVQSASDVEIDNDLDVFLPVTGSANEHQKSAKETVRPMSRTSSRSSVTFEDEQDSNILENIKNQRDAEESPHQKPSMKDGDKQSQNPSHEPSPNPIDKPGQESSQKDTQLEERHRKNGTHIESEVQTIRKEHDIVNNIENNTEKKAGNKTDNKTDNKTENKTDNQADNKTDTESETVIYNAANVLETNVTDVVSEDKGKATLTEPQLPGQGDDQPQHTVSMTTETPADAPADAPAAEEAAPAE